MALKVQFSDGSVVEYAEGVVVSEDPLRTFKFVNDASGQVIAAIPFNEFRGLVV